MCIIIINKFIIIKGLIVRWPATSTFFRWMGPVLTLDITHATEELEWTPPFEVFFPPYNTTNVQIKASIMSKLEIYTNTQNLKKA